MFFRSLESFLYFKVFLIGIQELLFYFSEEGEVEVELFFFIEVSVLVILVQDELGELQVILDYMGYIFFKFLFNFFNIFVIVNVIGGRILVLQLFLLGKVCSVCFIFFFDFRMLVFCFWYRWYGYGGVCIF